MINLKSKKFRNMQKKIVAILLVICMLAIILPGGMNSNAATSYTGVTLSRSDYDYAPSVMIGDGPLIKMWWGGGTGSGDGIYYSTLSSNGWAAPTLVMQKSGSGWDSQHVCDPSVIKGNFSYNGTSYSYAMYYTGTYDSIGYDSHVGVAFSNNGTSWVKCSSNPILHPTGDATPPTLQYGAGMQTAYIANGVVTIMYFDSTGAGNKIYQVTSTNGINFSNKTLVANPLNYEHAGDISYSPSESKWYVMTKHGNDQEIFIYETSGTTLTSTWNYKGNISSATTGNYKNHNPGWLRYPNGDIYSEAGTGYKYIYYGTGTDSPSTWNIGQSIYTKGWEFNLTGNRQGWTANNLSNDTGPDSTGKWIFTANALDPHIDSPSIEFPATAFSKVEVNIANQNTSTVGKIYFKTAAENYYSESKTVLFTCTNGGGWFTHTITMTSNAKWTGKITGIRVDPIETGSGRPLGIDYVRLTN